MSIAQMLLPEFDQEMANTRKMLERVPDGKFEFKPHEKSMSLGHLAAHTSEMPSYATATMSTERLDFGGDEKHFAPTTKKEILEAFDKHVADARALLASASDEAMMKTWTLTYKGQQIFSMPRAAVLRTMVLSHLIHHRAQLGVYLRMNNVEVPGMYGPSADEMNMFNTKNA
jgi:uncharacterized damage-inducible protein DinB